MSIKLDWHDDPQIIIYRFSGSWTVTDLEDVLKLADETAKESDYIIFDVAQSPHVPSNFLNIRHSIAKYRSENVKLRFVVGASQILMVVYRALRYIFPSIAETMVFVETYDEAVNQIKAHYSDAQHTSTTSDTTQST